MSCQTLYEYHLDRLKQYYQERLEKNDMVLPSSVILYYNWRAASIFKKCKYLVCAKFNLKEAKRQVALDTLVKKNPEKFNPLKSEKEV